MTIMNVLSLFGGLGLFLFGMQLMGEALEKAAGTRLKKLLGMVTGNRFLAMLAGITITAVVQSSSATTVMVVGFVNAGLMSLTQAVGVIMGANIGTTVTSLLLSVQIDFAAIFTFLGLILSNLPDKYITAKQFGTITMGLGILFIGMNTMSGAMEPLRTWEGFQKAMASINNPILGVLIGAGIPAVSGFHPLEAYGAMLSGAFDSARHIGDFLEYAMVLCVCGLACVLGARVGIFNVGGEGQLLLGAIFAAQVGVWMDGQPRFLVIVCAALAAMAVGGLYAFLPGVLKVKVKVNEVITTIMLNTIAAYLCQYLAKGPWKNANKNMVAATEQLGAQYWFGNVIPRSNLTSAVFAAAVMAFLVWYVMERTSVGYEMRITGENPRFAFFSGLRTDQIVLLSMVVSGAMCGLVGMFRVYGVEHLYRDSVSKDYYFEALMVAMIAQYKPVTVILLSLFFAVLKIGAQGMELIGIPSQIYLIIQTVIIFCMAAESGITRSLTAAHERRRAKRAAEERLKEELKHG